MVFWAAYEQSGGLMSLFISEQVNRSIGGWLVPASWFFSLTAVFAILCGPLISLSLVRWERMRAPLTVSVRFALGLTSGAIAYAVISIGSSNAGAASVSIFWPLAFYCLLTVGELLFSPTGFAMVGRYAPAAHQSTFMGIWLLSVALGSFIGGQIGAFSRHIGRTATFAGLCAALSVTALLIMLSRHFLLRRSLGG
jgi:POT family proton-dependent oligopeptide transporter